MTNQKYFREARTLVCKTVVVLELFTLLLFLQIIVHRASVMFSLFTSWNYYFSKNIKKISSFMNEFDVWFLQDMLHQIQTHLLKIRHIQELFRASEARDRNLAERNFSRINNWSLFQITVMLFVGVCQVCTLFVSRGQRCCAKEKFRMDIWMLPNCPS